MQAKDCVLGIDTSNYRTSVAMIRRGDEVLCDLRKQLTVKQGERGLRQSHALFQHIEALPSLIGEAVKGKNKAVAAVAVSTRPRPAEGSYMPVFRAGESFSEALAKAFDVPVFKFSHQEGHIEAIKNFSSFKDKGRFLCYHLSGGTCELLKISENSIEIIGGTKDISFGQVIDRAGVNLGLSFPSGEQFDVISQKTGGNFDFLKEINIDGLRVNLSGIDTKIARIIENGLDSSERDLLIKDILNKISNVLITLTEKAAISTKIKDVLFTGGVSTSKFIYEKLSAHFNGTDINIEFGDQRLSSDNAVGVALLGGKELWR